MSNKINVVYVDDDDSLLNLCQIFIKKINPHLNLKTFNNPVELLQKLISQEIKPDVIISDYEMPELDGLELLKGLKSNEINLPFIIITGKGREEIIIEALNIGVDFYLQKTSDVNEMFHELNHFITKAYGKRKAELDLIESEEKYRTLVNLSPESILIHVSGIIEFANTSALQLFEVESETDLIGKPMISFVHPDYKEIIAERIQKTLQGEKVPLLEQILLTANEKPFQAIVTAQSISYKGKKGSLVYIKDISDIKEIFDLSEEHKYKYKLLFDSLPIGLAITDFEGNIVEANEHLFILLDATNNNQINVKDIYVNLNDREKVLKVINGGGVLNNHAIQIKTITGNIKEIFLTTKLITLKNKPFLFSAVVERQRLDKLPK